MGARLLRDRIRKARRQAGFTQAQVAVRLGVKPGAVAQWEVPDGTTPTLANLAAFAAMTRAPFDWLALGRGVLASQQADVPALVLDTFAHDEFEEELLLRVRALPRTKQKEVLKFLDGLGTRALRTVIAQA